MISLKILDSTKLSKFLNLQGLQKIISCLSSLGCMSCHRLVWLTQGLDRHKRTVIWNWRCSFFFTPKNMLLEWILEKLTVMMLNKCNRLSAPMFVLKCSLDLLIDQHGGVSINFTTKNDTPLKLCIRIPKPRQCPCFLDIKLL